MRVVRLAVLAGLLVARSSHAEVTMHIDFESTEIGKPPAGFTTALTGSGAAVAWEVREDPTAPSGKAVLAQTSADTTRYRFPLCVYDAVTAADVTVSVRFKAISGTVDQAAGIAWRYRSPDNYYVVRANALENNVVLYKMQDGKRTDLKPTNAGWLSYGKQVEVPWGKWNTLQVAARGNRFAVFLNGNHLFDVEDSTFTTAGKIGLWTKADSVTAFDDFTIEDSDAGH